MSLKSLFAVLCHYLWGSQVILSLNLSPTVFFFLLKFAYFPSFFFSTRGERLKVKSADSLCK